LSNLAIRKGQFISAQVQNSSAALRRQRCLKALPQNCISGISHETRLSVKARDDVCGPRDRDVMMPPPGIKLKMISMAENHPTTYTLTTSLANNLSLFLVYICSSVCAINNIRSQLFMQHISGSFFFTQIDEEHKNCPKLKCQSQL
jgi:hypothetical protein